MIRSNTNHMQQNDTPHPCDTQVSQDEKGQISSSVESKDSAGKNEPSDLKQYNLKQLINKLNHINFQDLPITIVFKHQKYPRRLTLSAFPLPCSDNNLTCKWAKRINIEDINESYQFHCLHIPKEQQLLKVFPEVKIIGEKEVTFLLPETCQEVSERKIHRYHCNKISIFMLQNGALFHGQLIDYGSFQFRVLIQKSKEQNYRWIDAESPVTIIFTKGRQTLYSGECRIIKHDSGTPNRQLNVEPINRQIRRFKPRQFRSSRQKLNPSLDAVFRHPLFNKTFNLKVINVSGSGFALEEEDRFAVLLPGMIIPNLRLCFSDGSFVSCVAQVVYTKNHRETDSGFILRSGVAILDMPVEDHFKLLALLHQANDDNAYLNNKVNMDDLWDFFFETGFIYPQKYQSIKNNKDRIKATYEKLYNLSPSIASHFIYQENGRIKAHMAMIRFYETSWLIHHHAAIRSADNRGGLLVLNQVSRFINDSYRLNSMKMDYVFCYYRPHNKFPNHVFGGTARNINNPQICSEDIFTYFHFQPPIKNQKIELNTNWQLLPTTRDDLIDLETFYDNYSGGLMLRGLQLAPDHKNIADLASAYHKIGLKRERRLFSLMHRGKICAIIVVNTTDLGLNMSDLTNCVKFIAMNEQPLTHDIVKTTIALVSKYIGKGKISVLFYPEKTAINLGLDHEKSYSLWIYDTHKSIDHYFHFLKRLLKFIKP